RELVEAQLVNAMAPALLIARLRPLLEASEFADRHVVNVSAVEGQFAYANKTPRHPHTNMAKASLNMLTRTCAQDWAEAGIYINSVDTGWITQENPEPIKQRLAEGGFRPPLDVVDGAARVYDPIVRGVAGEPIWGQFLKDYQPADW
ncbi:MAG: SDR family oxidoreductase, partial [Planctomycetes bacterium]|nr:SDR family oxidoreductase [Planctomycetota bacterium]